MSLLIDEDLKIAKYVAKIRRTEKKFEMMKKNVCQK